MSGSAGRRVAASGRSVFRVTAHPLAASFRFRICSCTAFGVQYVMIYLASKKVPAPPSDNYEDDAFESDDEFMLVHAAAPCYVLERVLVKRAVDGTSRRSAAPERGYW